LDQKREEIVNYLSPQLMMQPPWRLSSERRWTRKEERQAMEDVVAVMAHLGFKIRIKGIFSKAHRKYAAFLDLSLASARSKLKEESFPWKKSTANTLF
jgi:hypothetical protein